MDDQQRLFPQQYRPTFTILFSSPHQHPPAPPRYLQQQFAPPPPPSPQYFQYYPDYYLPQYPAEQAYEQQEAYVPFARQPSVATPAVPFASPRPPQPVLITNRQLFYKYEMDNHGYETNPSAQREFAGEQKVRPAPPQESQPKRQRLAPQPLQSTRSFRQQQQQQQQHQQQQQREQQQQQHQQQEPSEQEAEIHLADVIEADPISAPQIEAIVRTQPTKRKRRRKTKYRCDECGRHLANRSCLTRHMRIHTGELPFACPVCGRCFRQKGTLTTHSRLHTNEELFTCEICGRGFKQHGSINAHMRTCGQVMRSRVPR